MAKIHPLIAAYRHKVAELGTLDREIQNLDMTLPEGQGDSHFDYLAQKRQEIETSIREMQEKVEFLSAWEKFKEGGPWSSNSRSS